VVPTDRGFVYCSLDPLQMAVEIDLRGLSPPAAIATPEAGMAHKRLPSDDSLSRSGWIQ
jgi:hypothetical protein